MGKRFEKKKDRYGAYYLKIRLKESEEEVF